MLDRREFQVYDDGPMSYVWSYEIRSDTRTQTRGWRKKNRRTEEHATWEIRIVRHFVGWKEWERKSFRTEEKARAWAEQRCYILANRPLPGEPKWQEA